MYLEEFFKRAVLILLGVAILMCMFNAHASSIKEIVDKGMERSIVAQNENPDLDLAYYMTTSVVFYGESGEKVGELFLESPLRFEGQTEKSAELFFKYLIKDILFYNKVLEGTASENT